MKSMLQTRLTEQYGLEVPFVSAGMGFISIPELAGAVSQAGGLGLLGAGVAPATAVRDMIRKTKSLTSRPFGVDYIIADTAFGPSTVDEHIDICVEEQVAVAVFFWNLPPEKWIARLQKAGTKVWISVGSVDLAKEAAHLGADALIVQGGEAGGHNHARTGLFTLLPAVVDAVFPVP